MENKFEGMSGDWQAVMCQHPTVVDVDEETMVIEVDGQRCIGVIGNPSINPLVKHNAKLMAAAPDLLAACIEFCRKVDTGEAKSVASYNQMKAAINKALN